MPSLALLLPLLALLPSVLGAGALTTDVLHGPSDHLRFIKRAAPSCPAGYKYRTITESFKSKSLNSALWTLELGKKENLGWQKSGGLRMRVTEKEDNLVIASKLKFLPGSKFTVNIKGSNVPGIVTPYIFKSTGAATDEVDLELVGGDPKSIQTVVWQKGKRVDFSLDGFKSINTQTGFHSYEIVWGAQQVDLSVNGQHVRTHKRKGAKGPWATDALPFKFGPWVSNSPGWAGALNWKKNPHADTWVRSIRVEGCAK